MRGAAWTREAVRRLRELSEAGQPLATIAAILGRTPSAVKNKAAMQGFPLRSQPREPVTEAGPVDLR
jgi:hypothetical protein